ncbi:MAG: tetratricopeptide repeat protein [bacterium]
MTIENDSQHEALKSRLQQDPDSLLFARVADSMMDHGQIDEAIRICEEGIRKHPYYVTGHMVLGKCYLQKKLFDLAEKEFKRVILFDPKYIAAHKYYGDLMREVGWDNTCEMSYRKILSIDPLDQNAREMLETLQRIKPKEQKVVTPEYASPENSASIEEPPVEEINAEIKTTTEPINIEDDLFSEAGSEGDEKQGTQKATVEEDENVITTILEDIFEDSDENNQTKEEQNAEHDTIDELNIKISPRPSPKTDDESQQQDVKEKKNAFDLLDKFDEETIEFGEMSDIGSETTEHFKSSENFEMEFISEKNNDEIKPENDDSFFDTLENESDDLFEQLETTNDNETETSPEPKLVDDFADQKQAEKFPQEAEEENLNGEQSVTEESTGFEREKIVTPTLGEIYAAQGQYVKAINVFEVLLKKDPSNGGYQEKLSFLKKKMEESQDA